MTREATITQDQVSSAAEAIRAAGGRPTARAVREAVGGGSMATVLKLLQVWQGRLQPSTDSTVELPIGLQRAISDFITQSIAEAKSELKSELLTAHQTNSDLIVESERLSATVEQQATALEATLAEKFVQAGRIAQIESNLARALDDVASERQAAEHARTELAKAQLRLDALPHLESKIDRMRTELERERTARIAAEQAAAVTMARLEAVTGLERGNGSVTFSAESDDDLVGAANQG